MRPISWLHWLLFIAFIIANKSAASQTWGKPSEINVISASGLWEVKIAPTADYKWEKDTEIGISDSLAARKLSPNALLPWARATVYSKRGKSITFSLRSPWMPAESLLLDDGVLVTFDQWGGPGCGEVCIAYAPDGRLLWSRTLDEIIGHEYFRIKTPNSLPIQSDSKEFTMKIDPVSISEIKPGCNPLFANIWRITPLDWSLASEGNALLVRLKDENILRIRLADGNADIIINDNLPDDPMRLSNRAHALYSNGKWDEAIALYQRAMQIKDKAPSLDYALANSLMGIYETLGRDDQAIAIGKTLIKKLEDCENTNIFIEETYLNIAKYQKKLGKIREQEFSLRAAIIAAPDNFKPSRALSALLYELDRSKEADSVLRRFLFNAEAARGSQDDLFRTYRMLGDFYSQLNKYSMALDYYIKGYRTDRVTDSNLYRRIAEIYENQQDLPSALIIYSQLVEYFKHNEDEESHNWALQKMERLQKNSKIPIAF